LTTHVIFTGGFFGAGKIVILKTHSSEPPSTILSAMPAMARAFGSTFSLKITELEKTMFSNAPLVAVPNFSPLQQQVSTQFKF
jgi:predicted SpoU family rRNA methylase